jgi:N-acetylglucosaminyl-diphospho-decaprenol L-rhamnosyltransferase
MELSIDIIIPVHGGWPLTQRCLEHLGRQTVPHRVFVVDNASPDGSGELVAAGFPEVTTIPMGTNLGFGAAVNAGIANGDGTVVVVLNNDVDCDPSFLEMAIEPLADPSVGMVAPMLLRPGRTTIDNAGLAADATLAAFPRLQGRPAAEAAMPGPELLGPAGAAGVYRRNALRDAGGFDERIFVYQEDLDLALRVRAAGWRAASAPAAIGVHAGSATAGRRSAWQREQAGFARGYLLRRYRILRSAPARALATELAVVAGDLAISRDLAAARGRWRGWRAAAGLPVRPVPRAGIDETLGFAESLRLRGLDYRLASRARRPTSPSRSA